MTKFKSTKALCIALIIALIATIIAPIGSFSASANENTSDSIKSVTHEVVNDNVIFTVTTVSGNFNRLRCGLSTSTKDNLAVADSHTVNADGDYVWTIKAAVPEKDIIYVFDLRSAETSKYIKDYFYYNINIIDETDYNTVVDSYYISEDGGFKFFVDDWYMLLEDTAFIVAPSNEDVNASSGFLVTIREAVSTEIFENITKEDFDIYFEHETKSVIKETIANTSYTIYYVYTDDYLGYCFFQANGVCYSIQFSCINSTKDEAMELVATIKDTIIILKDEEPATIKNVTHEVKGDKVVFTVTTSAGNFNRLRCGLSTSTKDNISNANTYTVNADGDYVWTIKIATPTEDTEFVFDLRCTETGKYIKEYFHYDFTLIDTSTFNTLVDGWYTSSDGGFRFYVDDWQLYDNPLIPLVESTELFPTNACSIAIYDAEDEETFSNKSSEDFAIVLGEKPSSVHHYSIGNAYYTTYYVQTENYECYVFQANGKKYFINFMYGGVGDREELTAFAKRAMGSILITNDDEPWSHHIENITHEIVGDKITFTITSTPALFNRIRCGLASAPDLKDTVKVTDSYIINADGRAEWKITTTAPTQDTEYVFDIRSAETGKYTKDYYLYSVDFIDATLVDGWYTPADSGFKFFVDDWRIYEYEEILIPPTENDFMTASMVCLVSFNKIWDDGAFESLTTEDFTEFFGFTVEPVVDKTTVNGTDYTMYCVEYDYNAVYDLWCLFQIDGTCYSIQFSAWEDSKNELKAFAAAAIDSIVILNDAASE